MGASYFLSVQDLQSLAGSEGVVIVDARPADDYAQGHLPGAVSLPEVYDLFFQDQTEGEITAFHKELRGLVRRSGAGEESHVVFYEQRSGMRASRGVWLFEYAGIGKVQILSGGIEAWQAAGGALTQDGAPASESAFEIAPRAEIFSRSDEMAEGGGEGFVILDVRTREEFLGPGNRDCCARKGRFPNSRWMFWENLFEAAESDDAAAKARVGQKLSEMGIRPDNEIAVYCHRGARSAGAYIALKELGYPTVRNYIGSWHEYARRTDLPLEEGAAETGAREVGRWEDVGASGEFPDGEGREVKIGARFIGVFRIGEKLYALKNMCPHAAEDLSGGDIQVIEDEPAIRCPGHGWCFSLISGKCLWGAPSTKVATYPVKVEDGRVLIGV